MGLTTRGRRDTVERAIVAALRAGGFSVQRLSAPGVPDLLLGRGAQLVLAEIKTGRGQLTPVQRAWRDAWRGPAPRLLRTVDDAIALVQRRGGDADAGVG
jgi:hypothetical protein